MLPLTPKSVKMDHDVFLRVKETASLLGYSDNQFIVASVLAMMDGADDETNAVPRIMALIRTAKNHQRAPGQFGNKPPPPLLQGNGLQKWWGD
jgi:hypothetical protein